MKREGQTLLIIIGILLGVTFGTVVFAPEAYAQRTVNFQVPVPGTPPPGCADGTANPCTTYASGTKYAGGCSFYDYGHDRNSLIPNPSGSGGYTFRPITFWPGTRITPSIFVALGGDPDGGIITIDVTNPMTGVSAPVDLQIGQLLPPNVIVPPGTTGTGNPVPYTGLMNRLVQCIRQSVLTTLAGEQLTTFTDPLITINILLVAIAIALYGYDIVLNKDGARKASTAMIKICLFVGVFSFTSKAGVEEYMAFFAGGQDEIVRAVSENVRLSNQLDPANPTSGFSSFCGRSVKKYNDPNAPATVDPVSGDTVNQAHRVYGIWERVDCMIASMVGISILETGGERKDFGDIASDPFNPGSYTGGDTWTFLSGALLAGLLWTAYGPVILLMGGALFVMMIGAFLQAVVVYVTSMIVIVFLGIIGPLVIPMVLFQSTMQGFKYWLIALFSYMIQPAIIIAYLTFMLLIIDIALYGRPPLTDAEFTQYTDLLAQKESNSLPANGAALIKALEFPKEGSLMWFYNKVKIADLKQHFMDKEVVRFNSKTQSANVDIGGSDTEATSGNEKGSIFKWLSFNFYEGGAVARAANSSEAFNLAKQLLAMLLLVWLTFTFLVDIVHNGPAAVGLESTSKMLALNLYRSAVDKVSSAMNPGVTR